MPTLTPAEAADLYARWVWRTGLSENTKGIYEQRVRQFTDWLGAAGAEYEDALRDEHVRDYACRDYRRKLLQTDKLSTATVAQHMAALGSFYDWLELGRPNGVKVEVQRAERLGLTRDDLRKVLRAAERRGPRDFALACVMFMAGTRVDETHHLDTDDLLITDRTGQMLVRYGKGGKPRKLPLNAQLREVLRDWLAERATWTGADGPALFLSKSGTRLAVRSMQHVIAQAGASVGVHVSPHTLRHTYGRQHAEGGTDLESLRQMMGHQSITTTQGYTRPRWEDLEDAAERVGIDL